MSRTVPTFSRICAALALAMGSLISATAWASATQGKPNPDCPQFAPGGFPFPVDAKVAKRAWHVCLPGYSSYFDPNTKGALWSVEILDAANMGEKGERTNDFRPNPEVPLDVQPRSQADFVHSGYDQGHMAPAGDFAAFSESVMSQSFYYTNIVPQEARNNRFAWRYLETFTRQWAQARGRVQVVTGVIFSEGKALALVGDRQIPAPTHIFKVVTDLQRMESIAFVVPNKAIIPEGVELGGKKSGSFKQWEAELSKYIVSPRDIEAWSGLRFNPGLAPAQRDALSQKASGMWPTRSAKRSQKGF